MAEIVLLYSLNIMFDITFLQSIDHFTSENLTKNEVLFDEWDSNSKLYIIIKWELSVEKYTTKEKKETKQLAILKAWDFLWEWGLNSYCAKEVKVLALRDVQLISIDAKEGFSKFMEQYPQQAKDLLTYIIAITNKRLSDSNKYITSVYQINKTIRELENITFREIFKILDDINMIMESEFLLFLEVNPVMKEYLTLKYDSRLGGKMQDSIVEKWNYSLEEIWIKWDYKILTKEIIIWKESLWNIIVARKTRFWENEKRIFLALINSLSWVLKQKKIMEEERDKEFSRR